MPQAVIYSRVSTEEQANEGKSIEVQIDLCRKWAKENKYSIVDVYPEPGKSATTLKGRTKLQEAIAQCQDEKIDALLVMDTDRLARNPSDHFLIKNSLLKGGTKIVAVNQLMIDNSAEGNFMEAVMAGLNAFQSEITGRKVKKSLEKKCQIGDWPGWAPLGYININKGTDDQPQRIIEIDPERGPLISELFRLYSTGNYSIDALGDMLFDMGLRSKRGKRVYRSILYNVIKNIFYTGMLKYNGQVYKGNHKPLTAQEIFEACQKITQIHNQNACRRRKYRWLLTGLVYCGDCGNRFYTSWNHKKRKAYYHGSIRYGCSEYVPLEELEEKVANELKDIQFSRSFTERVTKKAKELVQKSRETREEEIQTLRNRVKAFEAKRNTLEDNLLDQTIDKETFKRKHNELEVQIQNLENEIATIENQSGFDIDVISEILNLTKNIYKTYNKANFEAKRHYLSIFFERIEVKNKEISKVTYTQLFNRLRQAEKVRVTSNWLRGQDSNL
ncbi:MAG: recombinase family protein [Candidatus Beckwithbacteria bacterium]